MITKTGGWTYSYDYENRLTKVVQSGTTKQLNYYDGDGNRVQQVAGSGTFTYSYQGLNILYEKNVTGGTTTVTKHFYAGGLQVAKMVGSTTYYLHQDALGSTRLVTTATATIKFSSNYAPYGNNYALTGKEVFMYTGKMDDSATGLYYEGARYYDPTTGRFTIQDSITGTREDPMSLNRYIYARDNPMKIVDLAGHEWWNPVSALTSAVSAVTTTVTSVASAVTNAWNSIPPVDQAYLVTAVTDGIAVGAVAADVLTVGALTPVTQAAVGAAISASAYTYLAGSSATGAGAAGAAVTGAITVGLGGVLSGAVGGALGGTGITGTLGSMAGSGIASLAGDFAGYGATGLLGGKVSTSPQQLGLSFVLGAATPPTIGDEGAVHIGFGCRSPGSMDSYLTPYDAATKEGYAASQVITYGLQTVSEIINHAF